MATAVEVIFGKQLTIRQNLTDTTLVSMHVDGGDKFLDLERADFEAPNLVWILRGKKIGRTKIQVLAVRAGVGSNETEYDVHIKSDVHP